MDAAVTEMKGRLKSPSLSSSPEVLRLLRLDKLVPSGAEVDALSDLSPDQVYTIALHRAFSEELKDGGIEGGIDGFLKVYDYYEILIMSKDRKARQEIAGSFSERAPVYAPNRPAAPNPFTEDENKKQWWQFWRKD